MPAKGTRFSFHALGRPGSLLQLLHEMKKSTVLFLLLLLVYQSFGQKQKLSLQVKDSLTGEPLEMVQARILLGKSHQDFFSLGDGRLSIELPETGDFTLIFSRPFYCTQTWPAAKAREENTEIRLKPKAVVSQEIIVKPLQANDIQPITQSRLSENAIRERYFGADIPSLINHTPGINMYSDAGNGIGYSYFRLRGIDQSRFNFTVNGIPVNDPENQGFFFNNFADLASSAQSIQIQRGVGLSPNGTAGFGGSVNLLTRSLSENPEFEMASGMGSFGSSRLMARFQTGKLANRFAFGGRVSQIQSDGYRMHSGMAIRSYDFSAGYFADKTILKINTFGGFSASELAYAGIDQASLDTNRRFNPFQSGEKDAFEQHFTQMQWLQTLNNQWSFQISAYSVLGKAPRFQFLFPAIWQTPYSFFNMPDRDTIATAGDIMSSYRLDQQLFGGFGSLNYKSERFEGSLGFHANHFTADHFMEVNWGQNLPDGIKQNHPVYFNTGTKREASAYLRGNYRIGSRLHWFAELQYRQANFSYSERKMQIRPSFGSMVPMSWNFFNPRTGLRFEVNSCNSLYAMAGMTSREPTRFDYFQDDFATRANIRQADLKYEKVTDAELGWQWKNLKGDWLKINGFYMWFQNQIVGTGQLNLFGSPVNTNVEASFRTGLELEGHWQPVKGLRLYTSAAWMQSRIQTFRTRYFLSDFSGDTTLTFRNVQALLSPEWIVNQGLVWTPNSWLSLGLNGRYTSMQFLDNTENKAVSLPEFWFADFRATLDLRKWINAGIPSLSLVVNNISNEKYATAGSTGAFSQVFDPASGQASSTPLFFPAATRNWFLTLGWRL